MVHSYQSPARTWEAFITVRAAGIKPNCKIKPFLGINSVLSCEIKQLNSYFADGSFLNKASRTRPSLPKLNVISHCPRTSHLFPFQSFFSVPSSCASSTSHPSIYPSIHLSNTQQNLWTTNFVPGTVLMLRMKDITNSICKKFLGQSEINKILINYEIYKAMRSALCYEKHVVLGGSRCLTTVLRGAEYGRSSSCATIHFITFPNVPPSTSWERSQGELLIGKGRWGWGNGKRRKAYINSAQYGKFPDRRLALLHGWLLPTNLSAPWAYL